MAKGIDACAATVCINEGGYTIAILGNGLDICYPSEHQLLYEFGPAFHKYEQGKTDNDSREEE